MKLTQGSGSSLLEPRKKHPTSHLKKKTKGLNSNQNLRNETTHSFVHL